MKVQLPLTVETEGYLPRRRSPTKLRHTTQASVELKEFSSEDVTGTLRIDRPKYDSLEWKAVDGRLYHPMTHSVLEDDNSITSVPLTPEALNGTEPVYVKNHEQLTGVDKNRDAEWSDGSHLFRHIVTGDELGLLKATHTAQARLAVIDGVVHTCDLQPAVEFQLEGDKLVVGLVGTISAADLASRGPALGLSTIEDLMSKGWELEGMQYAFTGDARQAIVEGDGDIRSVVMADPVRELSLVVKHLEKSKATTTAWIANQISSDKLDVDGQLEMLKELAELLEPIDKKHRDYNGYVLATTIERIKGRIRERFELLDTLESKNVVAPTV